MTYDILPYDMLDQFNAIMEASANSEEHRDDIINAIKTALTSKISDVAKYVKECSEKDSTSVTIDCGDGIKLELIHGEKMEGVAESDGDTIKLDLISTMAGILGEKFDDTMDALSNATKTSEWKTILDEIVGNEDFNTILKDAISIESDDDELEDSNKKPAQEDDKPSNAEDSIYRIETNDEKVQQNKNNLLRYNKYYTDHGGSIEYTKDGDKVIVILKRGNVEDEYWEQSKNFFTEKLAVDTEGDTEGDTDEQSAENKCSHCNGTGKDAEGKKCSICHGSGKAVECEHCDGTGYDDKSKGDCQYCNGTGMIALDKHGKETQQSAVNPHQTNARAMSVWNNIYVDKICDDQGNPQPLLCNLVMMRKRDGETQVSPMEVDKKYTKEMIKGFEDDVSKFHLVPKIRQELIKLTNALNSLDKYALSKNPEERARNVLMNLSGKVSSQKELNKKHRSKFLDPKENANYLKELGKNTRQLMKTTSNQFF